MFKILCLDGGGSRGYFTAKIIKNIEQRYNIKVNEYFDLIIGTSTGALIAGALALDIDVDEIVNIYFKETHQIFKSKIFKGIFSSKYDITLLKDLISKKYKFKNFCDVKCKILITATNINESKPVIFESWNTNFNLIDTVVASAAAPIFFEPYKINDTYYCDGCIWANNPSLIGLSYALDKNKFNKKLNEVKILSIGTGITDQSLDLNDKSWGLLSWTDNIASLTMKTNVLAVEKYTEQILNQNFLRINFTSNEKLNINSIPLQLLNDTNDIFNKYIDKLDKFFAKKEKNNIFTKLYKKLFNFWEK